MPNALIQYFSATGNSELAAKTLAAGLQEADWTVALENIRSGRPSPEASALAGADLIGFVFPIFAFRAAIPMEKHLRALPTLPVPKPVFLFATFAGYLDRAFMRLRDILVPKRYLPVLTSTLVCEDSWPVVRVPGWIYDEGKPETSALDKVRAFAAHRLPEVWAANRSGPKEAVGWVPFNPVSAIAAMFPVAIHRGKQFPIFVRKSRCTKCGNCVRQCPTGRLRLAPYPVPDGECVGCYGCINACPVDAINTWFTNGRLRYRGPAVARNSPG